ncbi:hypothetical protein DFH06DRAFT_1135191 [Mycena polygramma]|nr:hypothetical protein DFH06DRAFT_1135191 [Mycena polygramma]
MSLREDAPPELYPNEAALLETFRLDPAAAQIPAGDDLSLVAREPTRRYTTAFCLSSVQRRVRGHGAQRLHPHITFEQDETCAGSNVNFSNNDIGGQVFDRVIMVEPGIIMFRVWFNSSVGGSEVRGCNLVKPPKKTRFKPGKWFQ